MSSGSRLYRSSSNKMLGGVCAGLADYMDLDPTIVRIFFVIISLVDGIGFLIYFILWVLLPIEEEVENFSGFSFESESLKDKAHSMGQEMNTAVRKPNPDAIKFIGIALIVVGVIAALRNLPIPWLSWLNSGIIWALILIAGGVMLIWRTIKKRS